MWLPVVKKYTLSALEGTPTVLESLLKGLPADLSLWDERPDPERFTLREMIAHLADWELIWKMRIERILAEDNPALPDIDEGQRAIDNDYARQNPLQNITRFRSGREATIKILQSMTDEQWERTAQRENIGEMSLSTFVTMMLAHDGYHTRQTAEWVQHSE